MNEKIYPSDLTDEEWEWIKDMISRQKRWTTAYPVYAGRTQCHLLCHQRWDPMAYVAHQFPQVAECLPLLASLEAPGGVGQNPRYTPCARQRKRGAAQTSHGGMSG